MLEVCNLTAQGVHTTVRDFNLMAASGQVVAILGSNGAGKSTLLHVMAGVQPANIDALRLEGRDLAKLSRLDRARAGVAFVPSGRPVFGELTVAQNLLVAKTKISDPVNEGISWFPALRGKLDVRADCLSGGEQQMLVLACALVRQPRALLIDEMSHGLAPQVVRPLMEGIKNYAHRGTVVLLVEQFATLALAHADQAIVLRSGRIVWRGEAKQLRENDAMLAAAYFGEN